MSGRAGGRFTVGRLMAAVAALAVLLAAGMYRWENADVDRATISANLRALRRGDAEGRRQAAADLSRIKPTDPAPVEAALAEAVVGDADAGVREAAAHTLGWVVSQDQRWRPAGARAVPDADLIPTRALLRALSDPATAVQAGAVQGIATVQEAGLVTPALTSAIAARLFQLLDDPDPTLRAGAISTLGWTKPPPPEARARALDLIDRDPDPLVRSRAITALVVGWPGPELYPICLARRAAHPSGPEEAWFLGRLLGVVPPPAGSIPALLDLMATDPTAARQVPGALARLGRAARPYLGALAQIAEGELQRLPISEWSAVYAVVRIDPASPEAQTLVIPIARHLRDATDEAERAQLTWLLDRSGPSANPAIPTLRAALQSPVNGVRRDAARLLGSLGPPAEPASADLAILSRQDPDPTVRTSAQNALEKLREPPTENLPGGPTVEQ